MQVFSNDQKIKYLPYLNTGLNSFEDIISIFTKYSDGGYYVKKIDHKEGFYREIVEGPYATRKEAEKRASFWCKFFKFKNIQTAHVFSFKELVCEICMNVKEYDINVRKYISSEYIYNPPMGASLMCLLKGDLKVILNSVYNRDSDFEKFILYVQELGVVKITLFEYDIFYLEKDIESNYKASTLRKLVSDYFENSDQLVWLYDELQGFKHTRGTKPFIIPGYMVDAKNFCMPLDLEFFKKYNKIKECKKKRKIIFNDLKQCLPEHAIDIKAEDNNIDLILNAKLVVSSKSNKVRDFYIAKDNHNNIMLGIIYPDDHTYIRVEEIENCRGYITTNLKTKNFDSSMWLMLYLCKVFNFTHLSIQDDFEKECDNETVYENILLFLDDQPSYYQKFGFKLAYKDELKKNDIISEYQEKNISMFEKNYNDDGMFISKNLKDIAHTYFNGMNKYMYVCNLLKDISKEIYNQISDCCLIYTLELKNISWETLVDKII